VSRRAAALLAAFALLVGLPGGGTAPAWGQEIPQVTIDDGPNKQTRSRKARYAFSSDDPAATFECKLDRTAFTPCLSPTVYRGLERGRHLFAVRAVSAAGLVSAPATQPWKIIRK
jgi:hypothetical protein